VCHADIRTWTAVNGKEVEAEFISNEKGVVKLKLKSGKIFEVPLNKLSRSDQNFLTASSSPAGQVPEKILVEENKIKKIKVTDKQISEHFGFWVGKWKGYNKSTNELFVSSESKWKEKGKSLETNINVYENGKLKDIGIGSNYYDKKLDVFVFKVAFEKLGTTINHSILNPENGELYGFPVEPVPPEGIEVTFNQKRVNLNTIIDISKVQNGDDPPVYNEILFKRQIDDSEEAEVVLIDSDLWYVVKDGTVKIIQNRSGGLLGTPGTRLPETIDGKPVTSIGSKAYAGTSQRVFIIPDTVTDVGEEAFADCYATLHEVKIGKNVKSIGKGAFRFSMPLKSITIPGSVVNIGEEAFFGCRTLADITFEEGVTSIGEKAFVNTYIKGITIPKSIKSVGKDAFESCTRLTTVTFLGDAPEEVGRVFSSKVIIYRKPEAKGWGDTWGGKPVKLISEKP
jgi:hypothetical protein